MRKLLIANRGEIAIRIERAARELNLSSVAVCSEADLEALHVQRADEFEVIGPAPASKSYLNIDAIIAAAKQTRADAVHPGYGFLSESADFAERVLAESLVWVGPPPDAIRRMGNKAQARKTAKNAGVPTVPGSDGLVAGATIAQSVAEQVGYPVVIKASSGGGGRGIRVVHSSEQLMAQLPIARAEAQAAFGDSDVYVERFLPQARHIEIQVFGDGKNFIHLGERDCSMQRRRQKVIEEAGAPSLPREVADAMAQSAVELAKAVKYSGAGTVEFLYDFDTQDFFFIEMNTRIQVEHAVTEMVAGRDLVQEQLRVAMGQPLSIKQEEYCPRGHAIEVRINAEDPAAGFMPSPGTLSAFRMPSGPFVRVDSGYDAGRVVTPYYDSLLAKIVVWGSDRGDAVTRLKRALGEVEITGVKTTCDFVSRVLDSEEFVGGKYHTTFLEQWIDRQAKESS